MSGLENTCCPVVVSFNDVLLSGNTNGSPAAVISFFSEHIVVEEFTLDACDNRFICVHTWCHGTSFCFNNKKNFIVKKLTNKNFPQRK